MIPCRTWPSRSTVGRTARSNRTRPARRVTIPAGDGTHTVSVEYRNGAGGVSAPAASSVILDQTAPTTTASLSGNSTGCSTFDGTVTVTLTASDATSGVGSTVYQVDGGAVHTYTAAFTVSGNGNHTVTYHSTDHAGNVEATKSTSVSIGVAGLSSVPSSASPGFDGYVDRKPFQDGRDRQDLLGLDVLDSACHSDHQWHVRGVRVDHGAGSGERSAHADRGWSDERPDSERHVHGHRR